MKKRIYSLDFLRIPAAMMIVMHHFQQAFSAFFPNHINYFGGRFSFGYVVEFFFVLSGFLMLPAVRKIYSGEVGFGEFAFRRARRLLPMLAVCALAYDAVEVISWAQSGFGKPLNISLLMTVADMLGIQSGWCFQTAEINTPSWYACVLLLCYVLLFALVRLCARKRWQVEYACVGTVLLGCGVFSFGFELPFLNYASSRGFYSFFFGVLVSLLNEKYDLQKPKYRVISLTMLLFAVFDILRGRGSGFLIAFFVSPALIQIFTGETAQKIFSGRVWEKLGNIQFHVYLWQAAILNFMYVLADAGIKLNVYSPMAMYAFAVFMEAFGALSYFLLEKRADRIFMSLLPERRQTQQAESAL